MRGVKGNQVAATDERAHSPISRRIVDTPLANIFVVIHRGLEDANFAQLPDLRFFGVGARMRRAVIGQNDVLTASNTDFEGGDEGRRSTACAVK